MREDKEMPGTSERCSEASDKGSSTLDEESTERLARVWEWLFDEYERKAGERETSA